MALLIINLDKVIGSAQAFRDAFREQLPDLPIRFWPDAGEVGTSNTSPSCIRISACCPPSRT
jgi:hypothetical protein